MTWVAAGAAVVTAGSAAYSASKKPSAGGSTTSQSPQTEAATNQALSTAENISNTPYTPYTGQVVANETPNQVTGTAMASPDSALNTQASSLMTQGANDISGIKQYSAANLKSYMDPYVAATLTPALNQENINYATQKSALDNSHGASLGGDRTALQEQALDTTHSQTIASDVGNAYSAAYTNAQTAFFNDQNTQIKAGQALEQAGGDVSKLNQDQIKDLMQTGGVQEALSQQQLDFNLNTFLTNQQWSTTQMQPLLQAIAASKGVSTNTSLYGPPTNVAGTAIGAAATVAGAYFTGGSSGPNVGAAESQSATDATNMGSSVNVQPIDTSNNASSDNSWLLGEP